MSQCNAIFQLEFAIFFCRKCKIRFMKIQIDRNFALTIRTFQNNWEHSAADVRLYPTRRLALLVAFALKRTLCQKRDMIRFFRSAMFAVHMHISAEWTNEKREKTKMIKIKTNQTHTYTQIDSTVHYVCDTTRFEVLPMRQLRMCWYKDNGIRQFLHL